MAKRLFTYLALSTLSLGLHCSLAGALDQSHLSAVAPQVKVPVQMTLCADAVVSHGRLMLPELATCQGSDVVCTELFGVDLGKAPGPSEILKLKASYVKSVLEDEMPQLQVEVSGPQQCLVTSYFEKIDNNKLKELLQKRFDEILESAPDWRVVVKRIQTSGDYYMRPSKWAIETDLGITSRDIVESLLDNIGWKATALTITSQGESAMIQSRIQYELQRLVAVATREIAKEEYITEENIGSDWMKVTKLNANKLVLMSQAKGLMAARKISKKKAISNAALMRPLLVRKGDVVVVVTNQGGMTIEQQGRALESGSLGQTIRVAKGKRSAKIKAAVVGRGRLRSIL